MRTIPITITFVSRLMADSLLVHRHSADSALRVPAAQQAATGETASPATDLTLGHAEIGIETERHRR